MFHIERNTGYSMLYGNDINYILKENINYSLSQGHTNATKFRQHNYNKNSGARAWI